MERQRRYEAVELSVFQRARDAVVCWLILIRAKLVGEENANSRLEHCIQLKKGTRIRLNEGQVELCREEELRPAKTGVEDKSAAGPFAG